MNPTPRFLLKTSLIALALAATPSYAVGLPSDTEIREILKDRVDVYRSSVGMVVGIIDKQGTRIISYGKTAQEGGVPVTGDTIFEIGSITKVFTAVMLADMAQRGELKLSDPISAFLPKSIKTPSWAGKQITLEDLSTQTSGFPRTPDNLAPKDGNNPWVDYSEEKMYAFLSSYKLTHEIGERYEYSNYGVGLLGHILSMRAGMDYEALARTRVFTPLGMISSTTTFSPTLNARLATGYMHPGGVAPHWDFTTMAGMGAIRSSANDMLRFLGANLGLYASPLQAAMQDTHRARHDIKTQPGKQIALGWHISSENGVQILAHSGRTGGFYSYAGFDPTNAVGVVVLSNSSQLGVEDIGGHILNIAHPLTENNIPKAFILAMREQGYARVPAIYAEFSKRDANFKLTEDALNEWGYHLAVDNNIKEGIAVLTLATHIYPSSGNLHDTLASLYELAGDRFSAIENFQLAIKLDPKSENSILQLKRLKGSATTVPAMAPVK